jgi:hypothetical protein
VGYLVNKMGKTMKAFAELVYSIDKDIVHGEYRGIDICFLKM